jgi:hypothetical protein
VIFEQPLKKKNDEDESRAANISEQQPEVIRQPIHK